MKRLVYIFLTLFFISNGFRNFPANSQEQNPVIPLDARKTSFSDKNGKVVIPYDDCKEFSEGLAAVKIGGKWGFVDGKGELKIQPQFDNVDYFSDGFVGVKINGQWGYSNKRGHLVIQPQFHSVNQFSEGLAFVTTKNDAYSLIDKQGHHIADIGDIYNDEKPKYFKGYAIFQRCSGAPTFCFLRVVDRTGQIVYEKTVQNPPPPGFAAEGQQPATIISIDKLSNSGKSVDEILNRPHEKNPKIKPCSSSLQKQRGN